MSITVGNCLELPSLKYAKVVGGHSGLERIVTSVSVLEYAEPHVIESLKHLFVGNEVLISALVSISDDVDKQCHLLECLNESGATALVVYYVGVFLPKVDERLIALSDSLGFPLIVMPEGQISFRYGEVITEISEAIFRKRAKEVYFVPSLLEGLIQIPETKRTVSNALRILSDRLHFNFIFTDKNLRILGVATWPRLDDWPIAQIIDQLSLQHVASEYSNKNIITVNNEQYTVYYQPVISKTMSLMHLFAISQNESIARSTLAQASEFLELFLNVWHFTDENQDSNALVHAILNDESFEMRQIAKKIKINVAEIDAMWILKDRKADSLSKVEISRDLLLVREFFEDNYGRALVEAYGDTIVAFFNSAKVKTDLSLLENQFMTSLSDANNTKGFICIYRLKNTKDVRDAYLNVGRYWGEMITLYPYHRVFYTQELVFAQECHRIISNDKVEVERNLKLLNPLFIKREHNDFIDTLCCFLLDADCNIGKTSKIMFVHHNTIKYRLGVIKEDLACDIAKLPGLYSLYLAAAIYRLTN